MPRQILIIEDEPAIRDMLADVLTDEGYEVSVAATVEQGLAHLRLRRPNLILCDLVLPPRTGREIYESLALRPDATPIPIIFITALPPLIADEQLIGDIQHVPVIYKPIILAELLTAIEMFIVDGPPTTR